MKSLKSHISLTIALFAILFTVQLFTVVVRLIDGYEERLRSTYAMVIISHAVLDEAVIKNKISSATALTVLSSEEILAELSSDLSEKQITLLKATLPNFYELTLNHFPSPEALEKIRRTLLKTEGIFQVESFANRHDQVYRLLLLIRTMVNLFGALVIIIAALLIHKEMRLWQFNHYDRMHIMALFGAPVWLRSAVLFKFALMDAFFATLITVAFFFFIQDQARLVEFFQAIGVQPVVLYPLQEGLLLFGIALATALGLALTLVVRKS